jgi:hypothetical protein
MNPALIATFTAAADSALLALGGPLTRQRVSVAALTFQGVIRGEAQPVGEYGERMEQRHTLTVAAIADVKIGDSVIATDPAATYIVAQPVSNNGYIAVYALRPETP